MTQRNPSFNYVSDCGHQYRGVAADKCYGTSTEGGKEGKAMAKVILSVFKVCFKCVLDAIWMFSVCVRRLQVYFTYLSEL